MADWQYTPDIKDQHEQYRAGTLLVPDLGKQVGLKLKDLPMFSDEFTRLEVDNIALDFEGVTDIGDYDLALERLYDLADTDKLIWVKTLF